MVRRRAWSGLTRAAGILAGLVAGAPDAPVIGPSGRLASPRFRERIAVALATGFTAFLSRNS
jgi:ammonia channel protein AmtB